LMLTIDDDFEHRVRAASACVLAAQLRRDT
jgi:hypothetical protein